MGKAWHSSFLLLPACLSSSSPCHQGGASFSLPFSENRMMGQPVVGGMIRIEIQDNPGIIPGIQESQIQGITQAGTTTQWHGSMEMR